MKILQVAHSFPPYTAAGTEIYAYKLSRELSRRNRVYVFHRINDYKQKEYTLSRHRFDGLDTYAINRTFRSCGSFQDTFLDCNIDAAFGELLDRIAPDVVHLHHLMFLSLGLVSQAKIRKIPVIFTLHDYWLICYRGQLINDRVSLCLDSSGSGCDECLRYLLKIRQGVLSCYQFLKRKKAVFMLDLLKKAYSFLSGKPSGATAEDFRKNTSALFARIDLFTAPSFFIRDKFIANGIPSCKIIHSPYGIDKSAFISIPEAKGSGARRVRFAYMGTLLPSKGLDVLVSAFKDIPGDRAELFIYGRLVSYAGFESYPRHLRRIITPDRRIKLMGGYDNRDSGKILRSSDILIVPSLWLENSPLVILEAFSAGTPVIASRIGGIPELVKDGISGLLFEPGSPDDLREKMEYVVNNPHCIAVFRKNIPEIRSIEDDAAQMEGIYAILAGKR